MQGKENLYSEWHSSTHLFLKNSSWLLFHIPVEHHPTSGVYYPCKYELTNEAWLIVKQGACPIVCVWSYHRSPSSWDASLNMGGFTCWMQSLTGFKDPHELRKQGRVCGCDPKGLLLLYRGWRTIGISHSTHSRLLSGSLMTTFYTSYIYKWRPKHIQHSTSPAVESWTCCFEGQRSFNHMRWQPRLLAEQSHMWIAQCAHCHPRL